MIPSASGPTESPLPVEGMIVLPRTAPFWAALSLVAALAVQIYVAAAYVSGVESRIRDLEAGSGRMVARVEAAEKGGADTAGRLIRLEEQVRLSNELLREIREALRGPPRR